MAQKNSQTLAVLDTNVWISGIFFSRGIPAQILQAWRDAYFDVAITTDIFDELQKKLIQKARQFGAPSSLALEWIAYIQTYAKTVHPAQNLPPTSRDPDDDMFIAAAIGAKAKFIASGDKDLLVLKNYKSIQIVSPREFLDYLLNHGL